MPRQITTTSDIILESDAWFSESAITTPELSFSSDSGSSDGGSPSPSSQFFPGSGRDLFAEPIDLELHSEHSLLGQYLCSSLPRKLRKRPPLHQLNITSVPFPPPNIITDTPLLGTWRRYDTPIDSACSSPSRVTDRKTLWQLPTPSLDTNKSIQSESLNGPVVLRQIYSPSPHSSCLRLATTEDALVSLVLAGELPLFQVQNVSSLGDSDLRRSNSLISLVHSSKIPDSSVPFPLLPDMSNDPHTNSRVAFLCQEIVRTERHYLSFLKMLSNTRFTDPAILVYLPPLVEVSEKLLAALEQDLSAEGVATSFLSLETKLHASFTSWCRAFGCHFSSENRRLRVDSEPELPRCRADSWGLKTIKRLKAWKVPARNLSRKRPHSRSKSTSHILTCSESVPETQPSFNDLAILPIQRVTVYRRFFEDLCSHVAPFESYMVHRAMMAATTISESCDRAQENADLCST